MSLFEFLFLEFSPRRYLDTALDERARQLADASVEAETRLQAAQRSLQKVEARVAELENDLGFLTLTLGTVIQALEDKSVVNKDELLKKLVSMDILDGVADGRFNVNLLRKKMSSSPD
jgi:hypothetical protein